MLHTDQSPAMEPFSIEPFQVDQLTAVLGLCAAEGWTTQTTDPSRTLRALTAPGTLAVVAVTGGQVVGFAHVLSDGQIQAYLALLAVAANQRGRGIGRALVQQALERAGGLRLDLLSDGADEFYERLPSKRMPGFRVYADSRTSHRPHRNPYEQHRS